MRGHPGIGMRSLVMFEALTPPTSTQHGHHTTNVWTTGGEAPIPSLDDIDAHPRSLQNAAKVPRASLAAGTRLAQPYIPFPSQDLWPLVLLGATSIIWLLVALAVVDFVRSQCASSVSLGGKGCSANVTIGL